MARTATGVACVQTILGAETLHQADVVPDFAVALDTVLDQRDLFTIEGLAGLEHLALSSTEVGRLLAASLEDTNFRRSGTDMFVMDVVVAVVVEDDGVGLCVWGLEDFELGGKAVLDRRRAVVLWPVNGCAAPAGLVCDKGNCFSIANA